MATRNYAKTQKITKPKQRMVRIDFTHREVVEVPLERLTEGPLSGLLSEMDEPDVRLDLPLFDHATINAAQLLTFLEAAAEYDGSRSPSHLLGDWDILFGTGEIIEDTLDVEIEEK